MIAETGRRDTGILSQEYYRITLRQVFITWTWKEPRVRASEHNKERWRRFPMFSNQSLSNFRNSQKSFAQVCMTDHCRGANRKYGCSAKQTPEYHAASDMRITKYSLIRDGSRYWKVIVPTIKTTEEYHHGTVQMAGALIPISLFHLTRFV